jgi:hypothetical protein
MISAMENPFMSGKQKSCHGSQIFRRSQMCSYDRACLILSTYAKSSQLTTASIASGDMIVSLFLGEKIRSADLRCRWRAIDSP